MVHLYMQTQNKAILLQRYRDFVETFTELKSEAEANEKASTLD